MNENDNSIDLEYYNVIPPYFKAYQRCIHCFGQFIELDNIGRLNCCFHPGVIIKSFNGVSHHDTRYFHSCCGVDANRKTMGCLRCDHISEQNSQISLDVVVESNNHSNATQIMYKRLDSVKSFAITKMPQYLFKTQCFTKPHYKNIVVNTTSSSPLVHQYPYELKAIAQTRSNYYKMMYGEEGIRMDKKTFSSIITEHDHEDPDNDIMLFDLHKIMKQMKQQVMSSPVYQLYQTKECVNDHKHERSANNIHHMKRLNEKANSIWKDDLRNKDDNYDGNEEDNDNNSNSEEEEEDTIDIIIKRSVMSGGCDIPFYIIKRIDNSISINDRPRI